MRSLRTLALISFFTVSVAFAQVSQVPAQDWRFAHPGATMVGGFRVKAMLDSPLVNALIAQATVKKEMSARVLRERMNPPPQGIGCIPDDL